MRRYVASMPKDDAAPKPKASAACAGLASGVSQVLAEHPLDTIKIRLQSRALAFDVLEGPRAVASKALSEEGVSALFRGLVPRLLTYAPVKSHALRAVRLLWRYTMGRRFGRRLQHAAILPRRRVEE